MKFRLQTKIFALIILVVLLSLGIAGYFIIDYVSSEAEKHLAQLAMEVAHAVADMPSVQNNVGKKDGHLVINPIAEAIREKSKVEFVVVIDKDSTRYSHPKVDRIGKKFVGGDQAAALAGSEYISKSVGTLGPSLRALAPIYREQRLVGAVVVGIMLTDVQKSIGLIRDRILKALVFGLLVGFIGAVLLARNIKQAMFGLEPIEIATILEEKQAILSSIKEGIISIDREGYVTVMNEEACKLLGLEKAVTGSLVGDVVPNTRLLEVLKTGQAEIDQHQVLYAKRIITNRVPIIINNQVVGAVASFRDMTEMQQLAEELTGVRRYVDALRAQSHEFKNRIHTIAGLLQMEQYEKAVDYVMDTSEKQQGAIDGLVGKVRDPLIGGLLLGKLAQASELGIRLVFDTETYFNHIASKGFCSDLITVIGNLIDNAFDAVKNLENDNRTVRVLLQDDQETLYIEVEDTGTGITADISDKICQQGFTTKGESNKGIGLTLIHTIVAERKGCLVWHNRPEGGVVFRIIIPKGLTA